jgi:hypothetical protein
MNYLAEREREGFELPIQGSRVPLSNDKDQERGLPTAMLLICSWASMVTRLYYFPSITQGVMVSV